MTRRRLLAGNWKMNGSRGALREVVAIDAGTAELNGYCWGTANAAAMRG
ncbi:hypothetical protein [Sphingomonas sp.]